MTIATASVAVAAGCQDLAVERDPPAVRRPGRGRGNHGPVRDPDAFAAVGAHDADRRVDAFLDHEGDLAAVRRPRRLLAAAALAGQLPAVGAVPVHTDDDPVAVLFLLRKRQLAAVRRPRCIDLLKRVPGQRTWPAAGRADRIEVPVGWADLSLKDDRASLRRPRGALVSLAAGKAARAPRAAVHQIDPGPELADRDTPPVWRPGRLKQVGDAGRNFPPSRAIRPHDDEPRELLVLRRLTERDPPLLGPGRLSCDLFVAVAREPSDSAGLYVNGVDVRVLRRRDRRRRGGRLLGLPPLVVRPSDADEDGNGDEDGRRDRQR